MTRNYVGQVGDTGVQGRGKIQSVGGGINTCELPDGQCGCSTESWRKVSHESDLSETGTNHLALH